MRQRVCRKRKGSVKGQEESQKRGRVKKGPRPGLFLASLVFFLLGYLAATLFDFVSLSQWLHHWLLSPPVSHEEAKKTQSAIFSTPKLEFYTLLTKENTPLAIQPLAIKEKPVAIPLTQLPKVPKGKENSLLKESLSEKITILSKNMPPSSERRVDEKRTASNGEDLQQLQANSSSHPYYLIQVASLRNKEEAEKLKALLILRGFEVRLSTVAQNQQAWFRISVGPYRSQQEAKNAQINLAKTENMRGLILKMTA